MLDKYSLPRTQELNSSLSHQIMRIREIQPKFYSLEALNKYGRDITKLAEKNELDPVIGREREIELLAQILCKTKTKNACIIGHPGVGKTAIVDGLAKKIINSAVTKKLLRKRIFSVDMGSLKAAGKVSLAMKELTKIVEEVKHSNGEIILFIDELHTLVGDATKILKPSLDRGDLKFIGATTPEQYKKFIDQEPGLKRLFRVVQVSEPSIDETIKILTELKRKLEVHNNVSYSDDALMTAAKLSKQYISDAFLPAKAIDVLDEAGARVYSSNIDRENHLHCGANEANGIVSSDKVVNSEVIKQVISSLTEIPMEKVSNDEKVSGDESIRLLQLENVLGEHIIGQDEAVRTVSRAVRRASVGLSDPGSPIATFLFTGPTGVGKTQLAKLLAREYLGSQESMIRLDMSEYMERHSISRLFGSPPGYVGFKDGSQLTEAIHKKPHSLILLDEIEKAHVEVFNALLQVMDDGRMTDGKGRIVDFRKTIIIMTSNIGFHCSSSKDQGNVRVELKRIFRPEFLNRIDEIIIFKRLGMTELMKIVDVMLNEVCERLLQKKNINVEISIRFKEKLISETGCDDANDYGARPLKRAITRNLEDKLTESILNRNIKQGDFVVVDVNSKGDVHLSSKKNVVERVSSSERDMFDSNPNKYK